MAGSTMLSIPSWQVHRTMSPNSFRLAIVAAVVLVSVLGVIAFSAVVASELTDRSVLLLGVILGFLGPTVVALLNLLRIDAVSAKVEDVHHDMLNGGLRNNVKKAISEDRHEKANRDAAKQGWEGLAKRGIQRPPRVEPDEQP
jgi:hypothetical protein